MSPAQSKPVLVVGDMNCAHQGEHTRVDIKDNSSLPLHLLCCNTRNTHTHTHRHTPLLSYLLASAEIDLKNPKTNSKTAGFTKVRALVCLDAA